MKKIINAEAFYTGGGIWLFTGELSNHTYFIADGDMFDVRFFDTMPNYEIEEWFEDGEEAHMIGWLDTEKEGPKFILKIIKWLRENDNDFIDSDIIEKDAKKYVNKRGWR